jgi:chromosomal replication initiator protein
MPEVITPLPTRQPKPFGRSVPCVREIILETSNYYRVSTGDVTGVGRFKDVVLARHVAMYLSRKHSRKSFIVIGGLFGNRDHSTVLVACQKIAKIIEADSASIVANDVQIIENILQLKSTNG